MELLLALLGLPMRCTCEARRSCEAPAHPRVSAFVFSLFKTPFLSPPGWISPPAPSPALDAQFVLG